jgi:hypothetical protein
VVSAAETARPLISVFLDRTRYLFFQAAIHLSGGAEETHEQILAGIARVTAASRIQTTSATGRTVLSGAFVDDTHQRKRHLEIQRLFSYFMCLFSVLFILFHFIHSTAYSFPLFTN